MLHVIVKVGAACVLPALITVAFFYLSTIARDEGDGKFLYRMAITFALTGFLLGIITWLIHRIGVLKKKIDKLETASADRDEFMEEIACRLLIKGKIDADHPNLRSLFNGD
jgi:hypothetical protein